MTTKKEFINYINELFAETSNPIPEGIIEYWKIFSEESEKEKPPFTENGKLILNYMKNDTNNSVWKSRDIAEGLFISSKTVSGAIRKLVTDGYVEKLSKDPVIYTLTEKGKEVII